MLIPIIISTTLISLISLIGIFTFSINEKILKKFLIYLVSLSAGALLGGAFFHLIPEAIIGLNIQLVMILILLGFVLFFIIEKFLHWRHCHDGKCDIHIFGYVNLVGDTIHNLIDGLLIAASFIANFSLGIITSIAVAMHEIPQEIGDFGVLLHSGLSKKKAILYNFLTGLTCIFGGIIGFFLSTQIENFILYLLPIASGSFIYISASDLLPEIRKENSKKKWTLNLFIFLIGLFIMYGLTFLE